MNATREQLDELIRQGCNACKWTSHVEHVHADPLYLHPRCHPQAGLWAYYFDGTLTLICKECRSQIVAVGVK